jgi:class 3 adenylate cyclase
MMDIAPDSWLCLRLYEKIIGREITTFADLLAYTRQINPPYSPDRAIMKSFQLIKELHWGFFRELDRSTYTRLWKELVVSSEEYKYAGDLKRNISISNIYVALLDIHGYTRFCQESKGNLSRLRKLDEFLHEGIRKIARNNCALANRERGDEIIVVAATATECLKTTLEIIDSFSVKPVSRNKALQRNREDYSIILPDFKVTAGIAGGNLTTPLIITESGFLSGYLLNTAARLQSMANELSPSESKVMVTQTVYASLLKENSLIQSELFTNQLLSFFHNGPITFKGLQISSYEVIFREAERYRLDYAERMEALYTALRQNLWQQKVFASLTEVVIQVCTRMAPFSLEIQADVSESVHLTNNSLTQMCIQASLLYEREEYLEAVELLGRVGGCLERIPRFDPLVAQYVREIHRRYAALIDPFERQLEEEVEKKLDEIFDAKYRQAYLHFRKSSASYRKLMKHAWKSKALDRRKPLWLALIQENIEKLKLQLYLGKK